MKKTVEEKLEDVLNINSEIIEAEQEILAPSIISNSNMDADNDFIKAKSNIASLIEKGEAAVDGIYSPAKVELITYGVSFDSSKLVAQCIT